MMGMYTEFYFRVRIEDGPVADWLERQILGVACDGRYLLGSAEWFSKSYDDHPFFSHDRWESVFMGGNAVYQESHRAAFRRKSRFGPYGNELVLSSSLKNCGDEIESFIDWITPHLDMHYGDFLGYSLYENSCDDSDEYREHPTLFFHRRDSVRA